MVTVYAAIILLVIIGVPAGLMVWLIVAGVVSKGREHERRPRGFDVVAQPPPPEVTRPDRD